jgi:hypothetical protein
MPLIHSKRPAAFKKNIETEMAAGKPQKQAVAIAYREAGEHKAHGGEMCAHGGPVHCHMGCYAEGGEVKRDAYGVPMKKKGDAKDYGRGDETHQKGVHLTNYVGHGNSTAGSHAKSVPGRTSFTKEQTNQWAKDEHHRVLGELRSMKGPHGNYADGGSVSPTPTPNPTMSPSQMGFGNAVSSATGYKKDHPAPSAAGVMPSGYADGGDVEELEDPMDEDGTEIHHALGEEMMKAIHNKDHKGMADSVEAMILNCMNRGKK